ncbi:hypothetical protein CC77DRAFT_1009657 [Alternaria alternata]|uniref:Knr4/Smi1-like domain-containing protein n=1 Tax=Alternaria alternata TaxID=5599 RepID=A0A177DLA7_ALTAL|nr:hypothetical protein CC77DRAFT_1009657 [Alternaria alternata]OAG19980.1 hypothetical protein CC77DRAFT_1009657 [Alternaria alternata]
MSSSPNLSFRAHLCQCDNDRLFYYTGYIIPELALLGYTDAAGRLISKLNNYDLYHDSYPYRSQGSLWFLWDLRAKEDGVLWPDGEEEKVRQAVRNRRAKQRAVTQTTQRNKTAAKKRSNQEPNQEPIDIAIQVRPPQEDPKASLHTVGAKEESRDAVMPSDDEAVSLDDIQRELQLQPNKSDGPSSTTQMLMNARGIVHNLETAGRTTHVSSVSCDLLEALDLVLAAEEQHGKHENGRGLDLLGAPSPDELLRWLAYSLGERHSDNWAIAGSRQAWRLYKRGALRQALSIDEAALTAFAHDFEIALIERLTNGRTKPSAHLSMPELLKAAEDVTQAIRTDAEVSQNSVRARSASLFDSPAKEEQIAQAETRLGIKLPSDYKNFLQISNGTVGHMWGHPLGDFQPPLHTVDKLRWLDPAEEDYFTGLALDIPARWANWPFAPRPTANGYGDYPEHFVIGCASELGFEDIDNVWLIPPSTVTPIKDAVKKLLEDEDLSELDKNSVRNAVRDFAGSEDEWEQMEWACVTWASGGTAAIFFYPGFKAWLERVVEHGSATAYVRDEDQDQGTKVLKSQKWLGNLFGKVGEGKESMEVPKWLKDTVQ